MKNTDNTRTVSRSEGAKQGRPIRSTAARNRPTSRSAAAAPPCGTQYQRRSRPDKTDRSGRIAPRDMCVRAGGLPRRAGKRGGRACRARRGAARRPRARPGAPRPRRAAAGAAAPTPGAARAATRRPPIAAAPLREKKGKWWNESITIISVGATIV